MVTVGIYFEIRSHEWHQGFHWEKRGKEKETVEKKKEERRC